MKRASYSLPGTDTEFWGHRVIANTNCWDYEKSTHAHMVNLYGHTVTVPTHPQT